MDMTLVGLFYLSLSFIGFRFAFVEPTRKRVAILALVWVVHLAATLVYFDFIQTNAADSAMYYNDPLGWYGGEFQFNTYAVLWFVQTLKRIFGGSFFDYFMLFQAFGFWGIAMLMRVIEEIYRELGTEQPALSHLLLFLPGLHFWTVGIGKDGILFLACGMAVWAAMLIQRRFIAMAVAVALMVVIRPHVGLIVGMALAMAAFFDPRAKPHVKALLLVVGLAGLVLAAGTVKSTFRVDVTDVDSVTDYLTTTNEVFQDMEGGSAVVGASLPVRILSLLFRPLFFDVEDMFGLVASFENLFIVFVVGTILMHFRTSLALSRQIFFLRFSLIFAAGLIMMLGWVYYNVGLGLRQKMMMMPSLLSFFIAVIAVHQARRVQARLGYA